MKLETYEAEARIEENHWWFVGRRKLFLRELLSAGISRDARILDIGTSTGTNLRMLRDGGFTNVTGMDASPVAIQFCRDKGLGTVELGDICALPFDAGTFDLVLATDIVEHVDDDAKAVSEIARVLRPGGTVLFTVPTFMGLWGLQDDVSLHKRRYRKAQFTGLVTRSGLVVRHSYYFNYLLFVPIWLARRIIKTFKVRAESENHLNNLLINRILGILFALDTRTAGSLHPPFGVSALCLARKGVS